MDKPTMSVVASFHVLLPILLILGVVALYLRAQQIAEEMKGTASRNSIRWVAAVLLGIYLLVYVWLTFMYRKPSTKPMTRLIPFETYRAAYQLNPFKIKQIGLARALMQNILLTIPVGFLVPLVLNRQKHPYLLTAGIAFILSILTEGLQYLTHLGICETDDVINNFAGCLIGMAILAGGTRLIRRYLRSRDHGGTDRRGLGDVMP